jgi:hypothetical protein
MPRQVFVEALKRGKKYKRRSELEKRLAAQLGDSDFRQTPQEITHGTGNDLVCAREAEPQAPPADRHDHLAGVRLPASHVRVVALEADGTWFGVREWSALEAPPPYQRARVQVSLEPGPTPLTAKNVVTLAKGAQAILDNFGTAGARR